ncbi:flavin reductase family protein [Caulobacter sp.]|uniref:flavin reductase family protein n=1 Tax=Caulobacter sp. TaxID=78 RepID=UPI002B48176A|nr:flavin reductase family protein [Caulobacter sp.]HJV41503.1 flavin reductase family protein [Caulobacter sp.]
MAYDAASPSRSAAPVRADFPKQTDFKEVLAHLAGGVAIISCWDGETPRGLLVSSITGLSVEPPRFLFCVRKEAGCHDALVKASDCGVALLARDDEEEAWRYASSARSPERFSPERWSLAPSAPPAYYGGVARAHCVTDHVVDAGTHSILVVTAKESILTPAQPLVAWNRGFL